MPTPNSRANGVQAGFWRRGISCARGGIGLSEPVEDHRYPELAVRDIHFRDQCDERAQSLGSSVKPDAVLGTRKRYGTTQRVRGEHGQKLSGGAVTQIERDRPLETGGGRLTPSGSAERQGKTKEQGQGEYLGPIRARGCVDPCVSMPMASVPNAMSPSL